LEAANPDAADPAASGGGPHGTGGTGTGDSAPGQVRDATPGTSEGSLRVVDPTAAPGLFEAVVSGVTGSFLGG
jgi:hypothetical protein